MGDFEVALDVTRVRPYPSSSSVVSPCVRASVSKKHQQIQERDDLRPPVVPGCQEIRSVWDPETFKVVRVGLSG